jgi:hypothetical protein
MISNISDEKIIAYFKKMEKSYESQIMPIVYEVYGKELTKENAGLLSREIFRKLCDMEKRGIVKNINPLPINNPNRVGASRWLLIMPKD